MHEYGGLSKEKFYILMDNYTFGDEYTLKRYGEEKGNVINEVILEEIENMSQEDFMQYIRAVYSYCKSMKLMPLFVQANTLQEILDDSCFVSEIYAKQYFKNKPLLDLINEVGDFILKYSNGTQVDFDVTNLKEIAQKLYDGIHE